MEVGVQRHGTIDKEVAEVGATSRRSSSWFVVGFCSSPSLTTSDSVRIVLSTAFGGLPHWGFSKSCAIWLVSLGKKQAFIQLEKQTRLRRMMTQELTAGMTRSPCHHPSDDPYPPCTVLRSTNRQTAGFCSGSSASRQFGSTARAYEILLMWSTSYCCVSLSEYSPSGYQSSHRDPVANRSPRIHRGSWCQLPYRVLPHPWRG
ncbi:hypothetical protein GMDG_06705 [Pseudogymnoascus destructans 20631-21]|uniref:Uncharacterized protein n=1 Tax=Pseudogymnoascus destructans (strain ATCC MYA-4855 / 20631-21) TaxID=658429 RepID=L8FV14_PSED2|nr:hypothetical protein GMDG_06705 [Pseudogymnoascus destructans 20631-21]